MLKLSMQFFAHKKGVGSTKNGRDSENALTVSLYWLATSSTVREEPTFIQERT